MKRLMVLSWALCWLTAAPALWGQTTNVRVLNGGTPVATSNRFPVTCDNCSGAGGGGGVVQLQLKNASSVWTDLGYCGGCLNMPIQGSVSVSNFPSDGSTSANQATEITSLASIDAKVPPSSNGTLPVAIVREPITPPLLAGQVATNPLLRRAALQLYCQTNLCPPALFK